MLVPPVSPGEVLNSKFRIERIIGAGGMGVVMTARHIDLGQRVAIKFMLPQAAADPANAARFAREARAAVQLRSEHAGRVLDVGKKGEAPYMVMEFLDGQDLDDLVREGGALSYPVAVNYVLQACEAIAEAHALGIVHRDLKPKNIFLTRTASGDACVKVLDFGLAKVADSDAKNEGLTTTNAVFGSPQYMSPEQMRSTKAVDGATDVWALGVTLYELLTSVLPFNGATAPEVCAAVLKDTPRLPSLMVPQLPPELEHVVLRCLEKDPARRFANVIELAYALEPFATETGLAAKAKYVADAAALRMLDTLPEPPKPQNLDALTVLRVPRPSDKGRWAPWVLAGLVLSGLLLSCALALALRLGSDRRARASAEATAPSSSAWQADARGAGPAPPPLPPLVETPPPRLVAVPTATTPVRAPPASRGLRRTPAASSTGAAAAPTTSGPLMVTP